jgi:polyribonucleotide nucleotidyltransferase
MQVAQQRDKKANGSSVSKLDLVLAGTRDAILMIEGYCEFLSEEEMLQVWQSEGLCGMCYKKKLL